MTEKDRPRFARTMMTLAEVFGESVSEYRMEAYFAVLQEHSIESIERAIAQAVRQNKFFPKPAELIDLLAPALANRALLAWHTALDARNCVISVRFEDQIINEVIRMMGGWVDFCCMFIESLPFRQKDFERLYLALAALPAHECCEYLPGEHERNHAGEYGMLPEAGIQMVEGKYVKTVVRLEAPKLITCSYLANERTLTGDSPKELEPVEDDSGDGE